MSAVLCTRETHRVMYEALKEVRSMFESLTITEVGRAYVCEKVDRALDYVEGKREAP